ncbi:XAP5, circadian clock regulator-domain-containing protein [Xylariomycetidae sp. FL2044]|nr:XAP5, circadian clock regulator-domain-containing protein [Xylariomycetidae sp. FL2044]
MSSESRFTSENKSTQQRISNNTVGLVALSDFRKRRAEVLEQQEREAREAALTGGSATTPDRSLTSTPDNHSDSSLRPKKKKKSTKVSGAKLSFGPQDDGEEDQQEQEVQEGDASTIRKAKGSKFKANTSVSIVPRTLTKSALRREAAERDALRREFLLRQEALKLTEIAIPFVFYDGSNTPGGTVRVKKGDFVWFFLDKSRKLGADLSVGEKTKARRAWARVGVDDLIMVRGNIIIPHHYEFLFFIMNKTISPSGKPLFDYSDDPAKPSNQDPSAGNAGGTGPLSNPTLSAKAQPDIKTLEGASDDPVFTKVVDRRWYERNKHIYPASVWQDFDPDRDYHNEVRRDLGGNTFFYS